MSYHGRCIWWYDALQVHVWQLRPIALLPRAQSLSLLLVLREYPFCPLFAAWARRRGCRGNFLGQPLALECLSMGFGFVLT